MSFGSAQGTGASAVNPEVMPLIDLSDVGATTGSGTTVVLSGNPTIASPTIASLANAQHDHTNAAGGGNVIAPLVGGLVSNLVIEITSVSALSITADAIQVSGVSIINVSETLDITVSGAGGLQSGSVEAVSTWYQVHLLTNADGTDVAGMLVPVGTTLVIPSPYTKSRRVGYAYNNASSNFKIGKKSGDWWYYRDPLNDSAILTNGQATVATDVAGATAIPPTSRLALLQVQSRTAHTVANISFGSTVRENGTTTSTVFVSQYSQVSTIIVANSETRPCPCDSSQVFEYMIDTAPDVSGGTTIRVIEYYDPI